MSGAEKINAKVSNIIKLNDLVTRFEFIRTDGQLFPTFSGGAPFQGVCIDAEDPGNIPDSVELYK